MIVTCKSTPVYSLIVFGIAAVVYIVSAFFYVNADLIMFGLITMVLAIVGMLVEMAERDLRCFQMRWRQLRKELCEKYRIEDCPGD